MHVPELMPSTRKQILASLYRTSSFVLTAKLNLPDTTTPDPNLLAQQLIWRSVALSFDIITSVGGGDKK